MKKFEFDAKKQETAVKSIEKMCYHCEKHSDNCPISVALGELKQEYNPKDRPAINYKDFDFDARKAGKAVSTVEDMCLHCEEHIDECPIVKTVEIMNHYAK